MGEFKRLAAKSTAPVRMIAGLEDIAREIMAAG